MNQEDRLRHRPYMMPVCSCCLYMWCFRSRLVGWPNELLPFEGICLLILTCPTRHRPTTFEISRLASCLRQLCSGALLQFCPDIAWSRYLVVADFCLLGQTMAVRVIALCIHSFISSLFILIYSVTQLCWPKFALGIQDPEWKSDSGLSSGSRIFKGGLAMHQVKTTRGWGQPISDSVRLLVRAYRSRLGWSKWSFFKRCSNADLRSRYGTT